MNTKKFVNVWDIRREYLHGGKSAVIGVNWSAIGPVSPATARRFARQILAAADKAQARREKAKRLGYTPDDPEK